MKFIQIIIPKRLEGERFDIAVAKMLPEYSRTKITAWIKSGDLTINKKKFKPKDKMLGDEIVFLSLKQESNYNWIAEDIPLNIVFEDDHIIVINKEHGLVTHPGAGNRSGTLANALLNYDPSLSKLDRAGIVHRLDKNTSGLMVVARNIKSQKFLVKQLQTHSIVREYSAIVYGHMISGGTIDVPIGRDPKDRVKQSVNRGGKEAKTHYRVINRFNNHTHVKAILETGRTHQIRVHLSHIGHPLIGDFIYGGKLRYPKKASEILKNKLCSFKRHALHSKKLTLNHPDSRELISFKTEYPEDMTDLIKVLDEFDKS